MTTEEVTADAAEPDHRSFADPVACGLAAALLLLFSVLLARGPGAGDLPVVRVVTLEVEFAPSVAPLVNGPATLRATRDGQSLFDIATKAVTSGPGFEKSPPTTPDRGALFVTPDGAREAVTLTLAPLQADSSRPWVVQLMIQFAGKPKSVVIDWRLDGVKVIRARGQVRSLDDHAGDEPAWVKWPSGVGRVTFTATSSGVSVTGGSGP